MSNIDKPTISIIDFIQNHFNTDPKNIIIWDTCSLLDILRLPYRDGNLNTLKSIIGIKQLLENETIFSLCSNLTQTEWNEHQQKIIEESDNNLKLTTEFHRNSIEMINHILSTPYNSERLDDKGLLNVSASL